MDNAYKNLARHLNKLPNGFPATESGVELKLLKKLFSEEEAELACYLTLDPQTAKTIAEKHNLDERTTFVAYKGMVKKGLIKVERGDKSLAFKIMPFIVGFYEYQNADIDAEFAQLFEEYYKEALHKMMTMEPSVHRVIPIEKTIPMDIEVMPYERASRYIETAHSWGVLRCICRVQQKLIGKGCDHTIENCLVFSHRPSAFDRTDAIKAISKEEALEVLERADHEGLVHSTSNSQQDVDYICNCCTCSCGILRGIAEYGSLTSAAKSEFYAEVNEELCDGCETCIDRCQFKALSMKNDVCVINLTRCFGCGLCVSSCPTAALSLKQKTKTEFEPPPVTEEDWREKRAAARTKFEG